LNKESSLLHFGHSLNAKLLKTLLQKNALLDEHEASRTKPRVVRLAY
jgi:hypothetical protein